MSQTILTITGPSSAGKTVLSYELANNHGFELLISSTTRSPRKGEVHGKDYYFLSKEEFLRLEAAGDFIEKVEYDGNFYGVQASEAERAFSAGKPAVLVAEPQGCKQIHDICSEKGWNVVRAFVNNPTEVLFERMVRRFYGDIKDFDQEKDAAQIEKLILSHSRRMNKIITEEYERWVTPAYDGTDKYEVIFDSFGDHNTEEVVQATLNATKPSRTISLKR